MIDDLWYKNAVIYCLSVGTYMDANGDGVGDFKGLLRRLGRKAGNLASIVNGELFVSPTHGNTSNWKCCTSFVNSGDPLPQEGAVARAGNHKSSSNYTLWE